MRIYLALALHGLWTNHMMILKCTHAVQHTYLHVLNLQFIVCKQYINAMLVCSFLVQVISCVPDVSFVVHRKQSVAGVTVWCFTDILCGLTHNERSLVLLHGLICNFDVSYVVVGTEGIRDLTRFEWQAFLLNDISTNWKIFHMNLLNFIAFMWL